MVSTGELLKSFEPISDQELQRVLATAHNTFDSDWRKRTRGGSHRPDRCSARHRGKEVRLRSPCSRRGFPLMYGVGAACITREPSILK
jgi:hypothetical protein